MRVPARLRLVADELHLPDRFAELLALAALLWHPLWPAALVALAVPRVWGPRRGTAPAAALLVVAAALPHTGSPWLAAALALLLLAEPLVQRLDAIAVPFAAHLPGAPAAPRIPVPARVLPAVNLVPLTLFAVDAAADQRALLVAAAVTTGIGAVATAAVAAALLLTVRARYSFERNLTRIVAAYRPVFYLHWHAPADTAYQIAMWLPHLDRIGVPYAVLVRNAQTFADAAAITDRPVILRRSLEDLDPAIVGVEALRAIFYVNTATVNAHLIRYTHLRHIQLNHGDSDKAPSVNPVFRMFDRNFVAGQAAVDRFALYGVPTRPDFFRIVGRPQVEGVAETGPGDRTVLYAPTWSGFYADTNYSSLPISADIVAALLQRGCTVIFRPHPYTDRSARHAALRDAVVAMLQRDAAATGRRHRFGAEATADMTIVDCFNAADAMVADVSSVVGDFLAAGKPLAMVNMLADPAEFTAEFPMSAAAYVLHGRGGPPADLGAVLDAMLGDDPLRPVRLERRTYYLGEPHPDGPVAPFLAAARAELGL